LSLMPEGLEQAITPQQMGDLIAFLTAGQSRKKVPGNDPRLIKAGSDGSLLLKASEAEIYGDAITFEPQFQNLGMWHGSGDHATWSVQIDAAGEYDVYLDYACASSSAGNNFQLTIGEQKIDGVVTGTGSDWSHYQQVNIGKARLSSGPQTVTFRPSGQVSGALIDLRNLAFIPAGKKPQWPQTPALSDTDVLRDPASVARLILDDSRPDSVRQTAVNANPQFATALIIEMTRDLQPGTPEEYRRIPWLWRVSIACGKRNDAAQMKSMLHASLPKEDAPLRDWQAVVIGGGIINGISQRGVWPRERIQEIIGDDPTLKSRWERSLDLASTMTDDEKVPTGTRYDALRMIALDTWETRGAQLLRYLAKGTDGELQMGAVSGLVDVNSPEAAKALISALEHLSGGNRDLALDGLLRGNERPLELLAAVEQGKIDAGALGEGRVRALREHASPAVRNRANALLK
ncbi:MAG TPA: hypothetical protein VEH27_07935, partial [Methylomirabilota bacterium]|nr:hypothetical protein [Methylomirabilota bacterium]